MSIGEMIKRWRKRRRDRIYEPPYIDGGTKDSYDAHAPKEIASRELKSFSCRFSTLSIPEEDSRIKCGVYAFEASRGENGVTYTFSYRCEGEGKERTDTCSESILNEIDALLREYSIARLNGSYHSVSALPDFYGSEVDAEYASGETILCYNNEDPFLPTEFMRKLCVLFKAEGVFTEEN